MSEQKPEYDSTQLTAEERGILHAGVCRAHGDTAPGVYVCGPCERAGDEAVERIIAARQEPLRALADEWERTADECERLSHVRAGLSDERELVTAGMVNRKRAENLRAALVTRSVTEVRDV